MRLLAAVVFLAAISPAAAADSGRFAFVPSENGVFRLDTETGDVALCMERGGALLCLGVPRQTGGTREAEAGRLADIEARIAGLEARSVGEAGPALRDDAMGRVKILAGRMVDRVVTLVRRMTGESGSGEL